MQSDNVYRFVSTPRHGYLVVPKSEVESIDMTVSDSSPRINDSIYLEVEYDAPRFMKIYSILHGIVPKIHEVFYDNDLEKMLDDVCVC